MSLYESCYSVLRKHARVPDVSVLRSKGTLVRSTKSSWSLLLSKANVEFSDAYMDAQEDEFCFTTSDMAYKYDGCYTCQPQLGTFKDLVGKYNVIQSIDEESIWRATLSLYSNISKLHTGGYDIVLDVLIEDFRDRNKARINYILSQIQG